jgi:hypothetical protein
MVDKIHLTPIEMTPQIMQELEDRGLIIRLCPGHHVLEPKENETLNKKLYSSAVEYGPHMLITVTVNWYELAAFGTHDENEEFILIGKPDTKPLYLVISKCMRQELDAKISSRTLSADDFWAIQVKFNDPLVSFFTMLKNVPHGEMTTPGSGEPPSFYVTEPMNNTLNQTNFNFYKLQVN